VDDVARRIQDGQDLLVAEWRGSELPVSDRLTGLLRVWLTPDL